MEANSAPKAPAAKSTIAKSDNHGCGNGGGSSKGGGVGSDGGGGGGGKSGAVHVGWRTLEIVMPRRTLADDMLRCRGPNGYVYTVRRRHGKVLTCTLALTSACPTDSLVPEPQL
jgi:hypothetical protein